MNVALRGLGKLLRRTGWISKFLNYSPEVFRVKFLVLFDKPDTAVDKGEVGTLTVA